MADVQPGKGRPEEAPKWGSFGHTANSVKLQSTCSEFGVLERWEVFKMKFPHCAIFQRTGLGVIHEDQIVQLQSTNKEVLYNYLYLKRC